MARVTGGVRVMKNAKVTRRRFLAGATGSAVAWRAMSARPPPPPPSASSTSARAATSAGTSRMR